MSYELSRRHILTGGLSVLAAATLGLPHPALAAAAGKDRIVVRMETDLTNLDPANRTGPIDNNVIWSVMQGLVSFKPGTTEWQLDAAEEITQVSDTEISFKLRPGLKFTGGYGDLTAEDVKYSFERFIKPPNGKPVVYAKDWAPLDKVEITGPLSGRILLKAPAPALWVIALADGSGRIVSKKAYEALGDKAETTLIGSGPYMLKEWTPREQFVLALNPDYAGPIKPTFKEIVCKPIGEQKTAEIAFQSGEVDFTMIEPESAKSMEGVADSKVLQIPAIDYVWFGPNMTKKPFDDIRVRQAIRLAVDVDAILQGAYSGLYPRANALMAESLLGYWKDAPVYQRDVDGAKKLLADAGLADGFKTKLTIQSTARFQAIAAIIQANLADIGIEVEIDALESAAFWALGEGDTSKDLELSLVKFSGKFDPSFQSQWFTTAQIGQWNWQRFSSKDYDDLDALGSKTVDPAKRAEIYIKMQKLMDDSAAFIWITHNTNAFATRSWLKPGLLPNGNSWLFTGFTQA